MVCSAHSRAKYCFQESFPGVVIVVADERVGAVEQEKMSVQKLSS